VVDAAALARLCGCDRAQAWTWQSGETLPRLPSLVKLSGALGVTVDDVVRACLRARARREQRQALGAAMLEAELR
jgi:transcriptional regulator with XRE-family HTH domain